MPPRGVVHIAYSLDWSMVVPFGNEMECLRFAVDNQLAYKRAPYGENLLGSGSQPKPPKRARKPPWQSHDASGADGTGARSAALLANHPDARPEYLPDLVEHAAERKHAAEQILDQHLGGDNG